MLTTHYNTANAFAFACASGRCFLSYFQSVVEQVVQLKKQRGNVYDGDSDGTLRLHLSMSIDRIEYLEKDGKVVAFIEWYEAVPYYQGSRLERIEETPVAIFVANLVANSWLEIAQLGRKMLRLCPEAKFIYWHDMAGGRHIKRPIKDSWRIG